MGTKRSSRASHPGAYFEGAIDSATFGVDLGKMAHFVASDVTTTTSPPMYGCYTVTFSGPPSSITCSQTNCSADLIPR